MVHRLQSRAQFQAVLAGPTVAKTRHFALHRLMLEQPVPQPGSSPDALGVQPIRRPRALFDAHPAPAGAWVGALVPKRWARRAVTRNTLKRQIYALFQDSALPTVLAAYVVRLRSGFDRTRFISANSDLLKTAIRTELHQLLALAGAAAR